MALEEASFSKGRPENTYRSSVRDHFTCLGGYVQQCHYCTNTQSDQYGTTNMKRHLEGHHPGVLKKSEVLGAKHNLALTSLLSWTASSAISFNALKNLHFNEFCRILDPSFILPKELTPHLSNLYNTIRMRNRRDIEGRKVVILLDHYSDPTDGHSIMGAVMTWIDDDWIRQYRVIAVDPVEGITHNARQTATFVEKMRTEYGAADIIAFVSDSASVMKKAARDSGLDAFYCLCHAIHNSTINAVKSYKEGAHVDSKLRSISNHFHKSCKDSLRLAQYQGELNIPKWKIIQSVRTRWSSSLEMKRSIRDSIGAVNAVLEEVGKEEISSQEREILDTEIDQLSIFEEGTKAMSMESATLADAAVYIRAIRKALDMLAQKFPHTEIPIRDTEMIPLKGEILMYIADVKSARPNREENPLMWWKRKQATYPLLALIAKNILSIPPSSMPVSVTLQMLSYISCNQLNSSLRYKTNAEFETFMRGESEDCEE